MRIVRIPIEETTAVALAADPECAERVGRLLDRLLRADGGVDSLNQILERTSRAAQEAGLTEEEIDREFAAYKAERSAKVRLRGT